MDAPQQATVFEQLANKAKRAGLLRYHKHNLIVITLPDQPRQPATVAAAPDSARRPEATVQSTGPALAG